MSNRRIAASGFFWNIVQTVGERFFQTVVFFVVARLLAPTAFGLAAMAVAPAAVAAAVMQGASQVVVQDKDLTQAFEAAAFWFNIACGVLLSALIYFLAAPLSELVGATTIAPLMTATACVPLLAAFGAVSQGIMTRRFEFRLLAIRRTAGTTLAGLVCVVLAWRGFGAWSLVIQTILTTTIMSFAAVFAAPPHLLATFSKGQFGRAARQSALLCSSTALIQGNTRLSDLIVGYFIGPAGAGAYRLARTIIDLILSITFTPLGNVLLPIFARANDEPERALQMYVKIVLSCSLIFSAVEIITIFGAEPFRHLSFGQKWSDLAWVLIYLAPLFPTMSVSPAQALLIVDGRSGAVLGANAARLACSTACLALGSWIGGLNGAAIGYTVCTYIAQISMTWFMWRPFPLLRDMLGFRLLVPQILGLVFGLGGYHIALLCGFKPSNIFISALLLCLMLVLLASASFILCRRELRVCLEVLPLPLKIRLRLESFLSNFPFP